MTLPVIFATASGAALPEALACEVAAVSEVGALLLGDLPLAPGAPVELALHVADGVPVTARGHLGPRERLPGGRAATAVSFSGMTPAERELLAEALRVTYRALGGQVLGQVRAELQRRGVTDVAQVAEEVHRVRAEQARARLLGADLHTAAGSDVTASVVSATTGEATDCVVWSLNLYLGLNREPRVVARAQEALGRFGTGCGTSAASGGLSALHRALEEKVARMAGKPGAVVFPTGYSANLGALSALPGPKDLVLLDRESHASMFDGVRLSGRKWIAFRHNDVADLADKLARYAPHHENVFVVVESAYSMSGDLCPLREIVALKQAHRFYLYVDEAHTFGFYGEGGRGYCHELGVTDGVDFIMSTLSKAAASIGGFVAAEEKFCSLLQGSATPYIFQACLTPPDAATALAALDEITAEPAHARRLHENNAYMRARLAREGFDLGASQSPVIPVYVPDIDKLYRLCALLHRDGIFSVPVVYPAVGPTEGRIRFIVNARHTREQIDRTVDALGAYGRALGVVRGWPSLAPPRKSELPPRPSGFPSGRNSAAPPAM